MTATVGMKVTFVGNFSTQVGEVVKVYKNGAVRVRTEDRVRSSDGRRLEAGQAWMFTPEEVHQLSVA